MPTVIDSLIVRLGLDPKGVAKQGAPVTKQLNTIEKQGERATKSVDNLTGSLGKFLALIGGTLAIRTFVQDTITATAELDRLSKNLNLGAGDITAWGNAAEELGGSAKGLQGSLQMLSREQTNLRVKGESSLLPYFSMLRVNLTGVGLAARPTTDILLDLAGAMSHYDRQTGHNILADMGFDEGTINLMLQGRKELEITLKRQKEYAAQVAKFAPEATKLQRELVDTKQGFELLGLTLLHNASPALETVLGWFQKVGEWARNNSEFVGDFLKVIGVGLGAIGLAALPIDGVVLGITALSTGLTLLYQDYQTWKRGGDSFIDWQVWADRIQAVEKAIDSLMPKLKEMGKDANDAFKMIPGVAKLESWLGSKNGGRSVASAAGSAIGKALGVRDHSKQATAQQLQKYFTDHGVSAAEAAGLAANVLSESSGKIDATGDSGKAYGLLQWHADRQANFKKFAGHDIRQSTMEEQMAFILHELGTTEGSAGKALSGATSAREAGELASKLLVRPRDVQGEATRRGNLADHLAGISGASSAVAAAGGSVSPSVASNDNSVTNHVGEIKVYTAATDANGIARDLTKSMDFLFTSQANSGLF